MSDGPHRSLKMKKPWRALAERADNQSYDQAAVDEQLSYALRSESKELPRPLLTALRTCFGGGDQGTLIAPTLEAVEKLRPLCAGSPLGSLVLDYAEQAAAEARCGASALEEIFSQCLRERTERGVKHMEEHYRRESTDWRAERLYARLGKCSQGDVITSLAADLVKASGPIRTERPQKRRGVDEGASLQ